MTYPHFYFSVFNFCLSLFENIFICIIFYCSNSLTEIWWLNCSNFIYANIASDSYGSLKPSAAHFKTTTTHEGTRNKHAHTHTSTHNSIKENPLRKNIIIKPCYVFSEAYLYIVNVDWTKNGKFLTIENITILKFWVIFADSPSHCNMVIECNFMREMNVIHYHCLLSLYEYIYSECI